MFFINAFKVIQDKGGKEYVVDKKVIKKITRDSMKGKDYDIANPNFWGKHLAKMKTASGQLLPLKDKYGQRYVYEVYIVGSLSDWMKPYFDMTKVKPRGSVNVFPAYDLDGKKKPTLTASIDKYRR